MKTKKTFGTESNSKIQMFSLSKLNYWKCLKLEANTSIRQNSLRLNKTTTKISPFPMFSLMNFLLKNGSFLGELIGKLAHVLKPPLK